MRRLLDWAAGMAAGAAPAQPGTPSVGAGSASPDLWGMPRLMMLLSVISEPFLPLPPQPPAVRPPPNMLCRQSMLMLLTHPSLCPPVFVFVWFVSTSCALWRCLRHENWVLHSMRTGSGGGSAERSGAGEGHGMQPPRPEDMPVLIVEPDSSLELGVVDKRGKAVVADNAPQAPGSAATAADEREAALRTRQHSWMLLRLQTVHVVAPGAADSDGSPSDGPASPASPACPAGLEAIGHPATGAWDYH